ncbi:MAG: MATE family efflux transporter [Clostridia bacterium]|nr:MATE family efflux transporter [Clostridia bacterium]
MARKYEIDMCRGPLVSKLIRFAIPVVLTGIFQILYSAADLAVVGQFVNDTALAAVGSTGAITGLILVLFLGLSSGVNFVIAKFYGASDYKNIHKAAHTTILLAILGGCVFTGIGFILSEPLLRMMDTPTDVYDQSLLYLRITFLGVPASMVYNFGAAILRSFGDTKRPFYFISCAGATNVLLNLLFVLVFDMDVDGVGLATVLSNYLSAGLVLTCLMRSEGPFRISLRKLRFHGDIVRQILRIGLPSGLQSAMFSIAAFVIQSSINSLGKYAMIACTTVGSLENIVCTALSALSQATVCFVSQNLGAKQFRRIRRMYRVSLIFSLTVNIVLSMSILLFGDALLQIYTDDAEALVYCKEVLLVSMLTFPICSLMETFGNMVRGLGYAVTPMLASLFGVCGIRILWIYTIFAAFPKLTLLYLSYPVSWVFTSAVLFVILCYALRKLPKEDAPLPPLEE